MPACEHAPQAIYGEALPLYSARRDTGDEQSLQAEIKDQHRQRDDGEISHDFTPGCVELEEILQPDHHGPVGLGLGNEKRP